MTTDATDSITAACEWENEDRTRPRQQGWRVMLWNAIMKWLWTTEYTVD